jgi:hypothetical protein
MQSRSRCNSCTHETSSIFGCALAVIARSDSRASPDDSDRERAPTPGIDVACGVAHGIADGLADGREDAARTRRANKM